MSSFHSEVKAETQGNTWGAALPQVDTVGASLPELEAETLHDTLSVAQALVELLVDMVAEMTP